MDVGESMEFDAVCPFCLAVHDMTAPVGGNADHRPHDGAVSICIRCASASVFDGGVLVKPDVDVQAELDEDSEIQAVRLAMAVTLGIRL